MSGELELSDDDLGVVARFALASAEAVLTIFEDAEPDDPRPRAAVDAARSFVDGAPRGRLQRVTSMDAHRAAAATTHHPARYAARAAGDAASAAYLHPLHDADQVGHILRATANAAYATELHAGDPAAGEAVIEQAVASATPQLVEVLLRYPPAPTGRSRVPVLMKRLDQLLRA